MRADQFIREGGKTAFFIDISSGGNQVQVLKTLPILWIPRLTVEFEISFFTSKTLNSLYQRPLLKTTSIGVFYIEVESLRH